MDHSISRVLFKLSPLLLVSTLWAPTVPAATDNAALEEIVVTAQRKEQNIQDVPVSITAFSGDSLEALGVERMLSVTTQVPNLGVYTIFGDAQQPSFSIRGIGLLSFSDSFEPPVAMYVDDVYTGTGVGQSLQLYDVERLEVLRGPQGTLFGRNSTGGLFQVISRRPTKEADLRANLQYGEDSDLLADVAGGGSLSERVRVRLAARYHSSDGWSRGFLDGARYDNSKNYSVRGQLAVDVTDNVEGLLIANYGKADQRTPGFGITGYLDPTTGDLCSVSQIRTGNCVSPLLGGQSGNDLGGYSPGHTPGQSPASFGVRPEQQVELYGASLQFKAKLNDLQFVSITAMQNAKKYYFEDLVAFSDGFKLDAQQFTQEFRLSGTMGRWDWITGAYFFHDRKKLGSFDPTPVFGFVTDGTQTTQSVAVFGQASVPLSDHLNLTAGARYTDEEKKIHYTTDFGIDERRKLNTGVVTGRLGLDWKPRDGLLLFASVASGFKSGGFNGQFVFAPDALDPVKDEKLVSFEVGTKTDFLDGRARFNATAFYYDYKDIQLGILVPTPSGGVGTRLRNAGSVSVYGAEAEFSVEPVQRLRLSLGLGTISSDFRDQASIVSAGVPYQLKGHELPMTPHLSLNGVARYGVPLFGGEGFMQVDASWRDKAFFTTDNSERESSPAYALVNLRAGWETGDGRFGVEAFLENATGKTYMLFSADQSPDFGVVTWGRPRWAGVKVHVRY